MLIKLHFNVPTIKYKIKQLISNQSLLLFRKKYKLNCERIKKKGKKRNK